MTPEEKRLLKHFRELSPAGKNSLLDYAEFLRTRAGDLAPEKPSQPLNIPRPQEETVVKAIKRLMANYPMLERDKLLHETSGLMTRHIVHKHAAADIIDELEAVFMRHYQQHLEDKTPS